MAEVSSKRRVAIVAAVWLLAFANLYYFRVADPDLWWQLRCGEDILQSGHIRQADSYSFTAAGLPYVDHEWLTQVLFAFLYQHGGPSGLVWLKVGVGVAFLAILDRLLRMRCPEPRVHLPLLLLGAHTVGRFLLFRPQIFGFVFFAATLLCLELDRQRPSRAIWLLPALTWLWANMHASFAVGIALIGYYWLVMPWAGTKPRRKRSLRLGFVLTGAILLSLLNPYGVSLWRCVLDAVRDPLNRGYVEEWQPLLSGGATWNSVLFFAIAALAAAAAVLSRHADRADVGLLIVFAALGLSAPRHIPLFAIVALPLMAKWFAGWAGRQAEGRRLHLMLAGGAGFVFLPVLLTAWYAAEDPLPRIRIFNGHYRGFPYQAVEFLRRQPATGHIWNELAWGGYLLWELGPQWKVSLDGRNTGVYPRAVVRDHFELFRRPDPDLAILDRYPVDLCVIRSRRLLSDALKASVKWEMIYEDDTAAVFRSRASALTNLVVQNGAPRPVAPAELFLEAGNRIGAVITSRRTR